MNAPSPLEFFSSYVKTARLSRCEIFQLPAMGRWLLIEDPYEYYSLTRFMATP
jgi:hypothetical protein